MKHFTRIILFSVFFTMFFIPVSADQNFDVLNKLIKERGGNWKAGKTKFTGMTLEQKRRFLGLMMPATPRDEVPLKHIDKIYYPDDKFDWRNYGGNWITSVKDQGPCGSCWAFAAVGHFESVLKIFGNDIGYPIDLSEQYLVSCSTLNWGCEGGNTQQTYDFLVEKGAPLENCFPYSAEEPSCNEACPYASKTSIHLEGYEWVTYESLDIDAIKSTLREQPLYAAFIVYEDFLDYVDGIYKHVYGQEAGGHAVLIVGYDDANKCFIVKNSWGNGWGESGFFRIDYYSYETQFGYYTMAANYGGKLKALFSADVTSGYAPLKVSFTDLSNSSKVVSSWAWDFGNSSSSGEKNPVVTYDSPGTYSVKLVVTSESGARDSLILDDFINVADGSVRTRRVPAEYATIQAALDSAEDGDTILIADGTYMGAGNRDLNPMGKSLYIRGENGEEKCQINGQRAFRGFTIISGEGENTVIEGLCINGCKADKGGGIMVSNSSPVLRNLKVINNIARDSYGGGEGGGIVVLNGSPLMENIQVMKNQAGGYGGGIYLSTANPVIKNMVVQENYGFSGGGIYIKNSSFPVLQNVTIENNDAKYGDGGGIYLNRKSCATIDNSSVKNNTALYGGGGIFFTDGSSALMTGVFIGANKAKTGAGLYCYNHCYPVILNCSIGGNIASQSGGGIFCGFSGGLEVANSILWGDTPEEVYMSTAMEANFIAAAFTDIQGGESAIKTNGNGSVFWLGGNLDSDPRFFDPGQGDLRIGPKSPCIDAGIQDTFFVYGTSDTILIPQRKFFETKPDIGAFESNYSEVDGEDSRVTTPESALKWQLSNFPNPFNPLTQVSFVLPQDCSVSIKIYDLSGSLVSTLINRELKSGFHTVVWNGKNYNGESVASGVYMCIMNAVTHSERMKIVLIK